MRDKERELVETLQICREALCGAMRVIADLDAMKLLGLPSETRQQRFVDEMHRLGIADGFGVRIDNVLKKYRGVREGAIAHADD